MTTFPGLMIIVVNYNLKDDTIECLESLVQAGAQLGQIIVVDNASSDGSVEALLERFGEELEIIRAKENRGYPHALNLGIPRALELGAQWALLLNNDTVVAGDFLAELYHATQVGTEYAMFGPLILYFNAPEVIWYLGYRLVPGTLIGIGSYRGKQVTDRLPQLMPMDLMHGCAMMVRKDVFETIGLFDDSQLIYGDDADFSLRANKAGFKAAAVTRAKIWHKVSLTMGRQKPKTRYLRIRNTIAFYRRYAAGMMRIIMQVFTLLRCIVLMIGDFLRGHIDLVRPLWQGFWDGWRGSTHQRYE